VNLRSDNDEFYYFGGFDEVYGGQGEDFVFLNFLSSMLLVIISNFSKRYVLRLDNFQI
jgi:hypothetical protein